MFQKRPREAKIISVNYAFEGWCILIYCQYPNLEPDGPDYYFLFFMHFILYVAFNIVDLVDDDSQHLKDTGSANNILQGKFENSFKLVSISK